MFNIFCDYKEQTDRQTSHLLYVNKDYFCLQSTHGQPLSYATWMAFNVPLMFVNTIMAWGVLMALDVSMHNTFCPNYLVPIDCFQGLPKLKYITLPCNKNYSTSNIITCYNQCYITIHDDNKIIFYRIKCWNCCITT